MKHRCVCVKHGIALCDINSVAVWCASAHLRGRVSVSVAVSRHLPGPPHIVVADGFPPNAGRGLLKPLHALINFLSQELITPADNLINTRTCCYFEVVHKIFEGVKSNFLCRTPEN